MTKRTSPDGHNLRVIWKGPRRITRAPSELVYECKDLLNESHALFHAKRLKLYADSQLDVSEEVLDTLGHNDSHRNTFEQLLFLRYHNETAQCEVQEEWQDSHDEETTWEPIHNMHEDIPTMLTHFLAPCPDQDLVKAALLSIFS